MANTGGIHFKYRDRNGSTHTTYVPYTDLGVTKNSTLGELKQALRDFGNIPGNADFDITNNSGDTGSDSETIDNFISDVNKIGIPESIFNAIKDIPISCFVAGSLILTPTGYKKVEDFKNGDLIKTPDNRSVPVKINITNVNNTTIENAPYLIPKGSLRKNIPANDLRLSPNHAIRISQGFWVIPRLAKDMFKQIKQYDVGKPITYYHLETPNFYKDHLVCNGTIVESFSGKQMNSVKQELYYQSNLYAHHLSGISSEDDTEGFSETNTYSINLESGNYSYIIKEDSNYYL
jgi:hypothetical protein